MRIGLSALTVAGLRMSLIEALVGNSSTSSARKLSNSSLVSVPARLRAAYSRMNTFTCPVSSSTATSIQRRLLSLFPISASLSGKCTRHQLICQKVVSDSMADTLVSTSMDFKSAHVVSIANTFSNFSFCSSFRLCSTDCGTASASELQARPPEPSTVYLWSC